MAQAQKVPVYSDAVLKKGFVKGPAGISLEQAKAEMLAAQEVAHTTAGGDKVPTHIARAQATRGQGGNSPRVAYTPAEIADAEESLQSASQTSLPATPARPIPARTAAQPTPAAAQPATKEAAPQSPISHHEMFEDVEFLVETYRDNRDNKWYGFVRYKPDADGSQPGEEKFVANSQGELNLKLLKGKANATLKVRSVVQARKMAGRPHLKDSFDAELLKVNSMTVQDFNALPDQSKAVLRDNLNAREALAFKNSHPEFNLDEPTGVTNFQKTIAYVTKQGWPITQRNLDIAWNELEVANKLEIPEPSETAPAPSIVSLPPVPATPVRKRGASSLVPGGSSGTWANGIDDDGPRAQQAANANQNTGMTPERVKELSKTTAGMAQLKREMRSGFKPQAPSYKG